MKHIVIYNNDFHGISKEIVAIKDIQHVWLELPTRTRVVIEYYNHATKGTMSVSEYYEDRWKAESRVHHLAQKLCCRKQKGDYYNPYHMPISEDMHTKIEGGRDE